MSSQLRHVSTTENMLSSNISSTCLHNMVNFGLLAAEIAPVVWGTPANFNGLRVLAALLHGSQVVGVSQTLRRWTEGAAYVRQGDHQVGHILVSHYVGHASTTVTNYIGLVHFVVDILRCNLLQGRGEQRQVCLKRRTKFETANK